MAESSKKLEFEINKDELARKFEEVSKGILANRKSVFEKASLFVGGILSHFKKNWLFVISQADARGVHARNVFLVRAWTAFGAWEMASGRCIEETRKTAESKVENRSRWIIVDMKRV